MQNMLSCKDVAERADAWLDGDISTMQAMQIRLHLAMCKGCSHFMGQLRVTRALTEKAAEAEGARSLQAEDETRISDILSQLHKGDRTDG